MVGKIGVVAGNGFTAGQVFGLKLLTISSEDELSLVAGSLRAVPQGAERLPDRTA